MDVLGSIEQSIKLLKEVEDYFNNLNGEDGLISICDKKIDYWEHYLEFNQLVPKEVYRIAREIKRLRILRRGYKNDAEIIKLFKDNAAKMQQVNNRDMLLSQLYKTKNKQKNARYGYSAYTEDERNEILGIKKEGIEC